VKVTDGEKVVSSDELRGGERYVLRIDEDGTEHLEHLPRRPNDDGWPKLSVSPEAYKRAREFTQSMGRNRGFKPPVSWVATVLLLHACELEEARSIVRKGIAEMLLGTDDEA